MMLSEREIAILFFIRVYLEDNGTTPDESEIADLFDITTIEVKQCLRPLIQRGHISIRETDRIIVLENHDIKVRTSHGNTA